MKSNPFFRKSSPVTAFALLSFGLMAGCSDSSTAPTLDNQHPGDISGNTGVIDPCNGLTSMIGDDGTLYCFDNNGIMVPPDETPVVDTDPFADPVIDPTVNPSVKPAVDSTTGAPSIDIPAEPAVNTCTELDGSIAAQNTIITAADGSTYMYNNKCQKITLSEPVSSSSSLTPQPNSSSEADTPTAYSSSSESVPVVSSSSYESSSNGNVPAIAYAASGATLTNDNGCVTVNGGEVLITCAGEYDFSGSYKGADAQIRIYSPKADSGVYLNLRGLTLENTVDAPIYVQMASKTFVVAKSETTNTLSDGSTRTKSYTYVNDKGAEKIDTTGAAIYSKDDLTIKGAGTLVVKGNYNNGIQSSNDLRFRGETIINVTAKNNGIKGKGMVDIEKGNITIAATTGDGIKSDECTVNGSDTTITDGKGIVSIKGGTINITKAGDDGIQAFNSIQISDSVSIPNIKVNSTGKGIVSDNRVYINAGEIDVTSTDDGIHSNLNIYFNGGNTVIATDTRKGDGVHADSSLYINDGTIYVKQAYEGFEGWYIKASGGTTAVNVTDDGWNAAGGTDGSGNTNNTQPGGWGRPGMGGGMGGSNSSGTLIVTSGVHYVKTGSGDVDGFDSNGPLTISGGVVVVECQISGGMGGSYDSDGTATLTTPTLLGFSKSRSEAGTNYTVSFNANSYYGNSNIAFKPSTSGNYMQGTSQVSTVSNINSYAKSTTFPNGLVVYYN